MINYDLTKIRAIIFDLDGVLSAETISLGVDGTPLCASPFFLAVR